MIVLLLKSILLSVGVMLALPLLRRASAATRHAWIVVGFVAIAALPLLTQVVPPRRVHVPVTQTALVVMHVQLNTFEVAEPAVRPAAASASEPSNATSPQDPLAVVEWLWFAGVALLLGRLFVQWLRLTRIVKRGRRLADGTIACDVEMPCTTWWRRSEILVPRNFQEWEPSVRCSTILHERAHVSRRDCQAQLFMHVICCLTWPNAIAWLLFRKARLLGEHAADDVVLLQGIRPAGYATDLLSVVRRAKKSAPVPAIAMATQPDLSRRIRMILNSTRRRGAASVLFLLASLLIFAVAATPLAGLGITAAQQKTTIKGTVPKALKAQHAKWVKAAKCEDCHRDLPNWHREAPDKKYQKWSVELRGYLLECGKNVKKFPYNFHPEGSGSMGTNLPGKGKKIIDDLRNQGAILHTAKPVVVKSGAKATFDFKVQPNERRERHWLVVLKANDSE